MKPRDNHFQPADGRNDDPGRGTGRAACSIRKPAVAGLFYPAHPEELASTVDDLLGHARRNSVGSSPPPIRALIAPHAGYAYSGATAAEAYRLLDPEAIHTVFLLAPSHYSHERDASVCGAAVYRTPLGDVPISEKAARLAGQYPFRLETPGQVDRPPWAGQSSRATPVPGEETAHTWEHADEVQVPFLQRTLRDFSLVPVICGHTDPQAAAEVLGHFLDDKTLVIASSDLSHFHPYDEARSLDHLCINRIRDLDADALDGEQACGHVPIAILLRLAEKLGWQAELLDYRNSGDTSGDKAKVVGYASLGFFDSDPPLLSRNEKRWLLDQTRKRLQQVVRTPQATCILPADMPAVFESERASFVTLTKHGQLRGCIGNLSPRSGLFVSVMENVAKAALRDSRFDPVTAEELGDIRIEISVLGPSRRLEFNTPEELLSKLQPHRHGVILDSQGRAATFLPQVWRQLPDKRAFLNQLARKSGSPEDAWRQPDVRISVYPVISFEEELAPG